MHLGLLCCLMELGAKRSELGQKFLPQSRVRVFRDERARSTPLEPKLMFWIVSYHLGPLGFVTKLGAKHSELVKSSCHEVASVFFATNTPDPPHWTLNYCFVVFCTISVHLGPLSCLTKLGAKHSELVQKFMPRSRVGFFSRRTHPIHPIGP